MKISPYANDQWYYLPKPRDPDKDLLNFVNNNGEFSLWREEAFEKHLNRYIRANKFLAKLNLNGQRIKRLLLDERPWYSIGDLTYNLHKDKLMI